jgi:SAM-dependent methyltransferase
MDILGHQSRAWDAEVERGSEWTKPVSHEVIEAARRGRWSVLLTETKPVPREWFPEMRGLEVLCLASGGGQQAPTFAAAGARVTVLDNSPRQLAQDRLVAEREGLELRTVRGDMADLSAFPDESFDLVFHPTSNLFVPDVRPVWREAFRVLRRGGTLLAGFNNPHIYLFGPAEPAELTVKYELPYSDLHNLSEEERLRHFGPDAPLEFSHTLTDLLGGQLDAGFRLVGFYEDRHRQHPLARYCGTYIATRAVKPQT